MTLTQIVKETRKLPREQRAELADRISLDLAQGIAPEIEQAWGDTALRRLAELESGKTKLVPGAKVMARARKIIGQ
jgi:putative addiction module component (TIGR02574 family)